MSQLPSTARCKIAALSVAAAAALAVSGAARAADKPAPFSPDVPAAEALLHGPDGAPRGRVAFFPNPHGISLMAQLTGLPAGTHAFHLHETGSCEPDFTAAGGHFNPTGAAHGILDPDGPHLGDLPNIHVPESGELTLEYFVRNVSVDPMAANTLFDDNGSAVVIHQGADDYVTDPAGAAGTRISCGVVEPR